MTKVLINKNFKNLLICLCLLFITYTFCSCSIKESSRFSSIFMAMKYGIASDVKEYISKNPDVIKTKETETVQDIFITNDEFPIIPTIEAPPLSYAIAKCTTETESNAEMAIELINSGFPINEKVAGYIKPYFKIGCDRKHKYEINKDLNLTPLHIASGKNLIKIAEALIHKGADVNSVDYYGNTPIFYCKDAKIAKLLVSKGANLNVKNKNGDTSLHCAVRSQNIELIKYMAELKANQNVKNNSGYTPLMLFAKSCIWDGKSDLIKEIAKILIKNGADPNSAIKYYREEGHEFDYIADHIELLTKNKTNLIDSQKQRPVLFKIQRNRAYGMVLY